MSTDKPTPFELCRLARELGHFNALRAEDQTTDQALDAALRLWIRAQRVCERAPTEMGLLKKQLADAEEKWRQEQAANDAKAKKIYTLDEVATELGLKSTRQIIRHIKSMDKDWEQVLKKKKMNGTAFEAFKFYYETSKKCNRIEGRRLRTSDSVK